MISFKEYVALLESVLDGSNFDHWEGNYEHEHHVDGHEVKVFYTQVHGKGKHYAIDFSVNSRFGAFDSKQATGHTSHKIATFVKASMHHFIKHVEPDSLFAKGNTDDKHKFYGKYFRHMSKKYGYRKTHHNVLGHELHTNA